MWSRQVFIFVGVMSVSGAAIAGLSIRGLPAKQVKFDVKAASRPAVTAQDLAGWIIEGRRDFAVVDLRDKGAFEAGHVRGAIHCGTCHESAADGRRAMEQHAGELSKSLVLYDERDRDSVELPKMIASNPRLIMLKGGYAAWKSDVLAPVNFANLTDEDRIAEARKREVVRAFFAGERTVGAAPVPVPVTPVRRVNVQRASAPSEGC